MAAGVVDDAVQAGVAALGAAVDGLLDSDVQSLDAASFAAVLSAIEVQRRRLDAVDVRLLAAADQAHVAGALCRSSLPDLLTYQLRLSPGEARARVQRARDLGPRCSLSGQRLDPIHPQLARAQEAGEISGAHVTVASAVLRNVPSRYNLDALAEAEKFLLHAARHQHPPALARSGQLLLQRLDPDGSAPNEERLHAQRRLTLRRGRDRSWTLQGSLTEEAGLVWQTILDTLSAPAPATGDAQRDTRTAEQRTHDALRELGIRLLHSGVPTGDGNPAVTILIRTTDTELADPAGLAQTEHGDLVRLASLAALCSDAELIPWTFERDHSRRQLVLGRSRRLANRAQRRALTARDGGCSFPACERPASWCEVHHVREWARQHGPTDIDNLCLLCPYHHREFSRQGWSVTITDARPTWTPPAWIDPHQSPRRNNAHHLPTVDLPREALRTNQPSADPPRRQ